MTLQDVVAPAKPRGASIPIELVTSDFADPKTAATAGRPQAGCDLPSRGHRVGEAEADFDKGYRINLDGTRYLIDADPGHRRRLQAAGGVHLVHRGVRRAVPGHDRRRVLQHAADHLRHAEGDRRTAARRLHPQGLPGRHRHPPADHLRAAGRAEQGGVRLLLQHHPRAAGRQGSDPAGVRGRSPLARLAALGGGLPGPCRQPWIGERHRPAPQRWRCRACR